MRGPGRRRRWRSTCSADGLQTGSVSHFSGPGPVPVRSTRCRWHLVGHPSARPLRVLGPDENLQAMQGPPQVRITLKSLLVAFADGSAVVADVVADRAALVALGDRWWGFLRRVLALHRHRGALRRRGLRAGLRRGCRECEQRDQELQPCASREIPHLPVRVGASPRMGQFSPECAVRRRRLGFQRCVGRASTSSSWV